ncbi:MAG: galactokinase [Ruminococcaceae bacterium]|nr:galactokinase [Oscillospiraceae bacterium]
MLSGILKEKIKNGEYDGCFEKIYGGSAEIAGYQQRYISAIEKFEEKYGTDREIAIYSAPGRTEICGNHTDHNCGLIVAAAISDDTVCIASKNSENVVNIVSDGYEDIPSVNLEKLRAVISDEGTTKGLVKGICAFIIKEGGRCEGLDLYITSNVLKGSGLSSSASFENAVAAAINGEYNDNKFTAVELAQISQKAENEYFGKPCGVMDQTVSAVGGTVCLDLEDSTNPKVSELPLDLNAFGLVLCTVDSRASHDDLTEEYASITREMKEISQIFWKDSLRRLDLATLVNHISFLRDMVGDRAILRGMHFYMECKRVEDLCRATETADKDLFLQKITESGHSSYEYLQNAYVSSNARQQPMAVALSVAQSFLQDIGGAWRLQGGGFAGSIQCFVPKDRYEEFAKYMETVLGEGCCKVIALRSEGAVKVMG